LRRWAVSLSVLLTLRTGRMATPGEPRRTRRRCQGNRRLRAPTPAGGHPLGRQRATPITDGRPSTAGPTCCPPHRGPSRPGHRTPAAARSGSLPNLVIQPQNPAAVRLSARRPTLDENGSNDVQQRRWTDHRHEGQGLQPDLVHRAMPKQRSTAVDLRPRRRPRRRLRAGRVLPPRAGREPQGRRAGQAAAEPSAIGLTVKTRRRVTQGRQVGSTRASHTDAIREPGRGTNSSSQFVVSADHSVPA
jgi:hypothetical protein